MSDECPSGTGRDNRVLIQPVSSGRSQVYHTADCRVVSRHGREQMISRPRESLPEGWDECRYCSGEFDPQECSNDETSCPICGEMVPHLSPHIRRTHSTGGGSDE